jgi:cytochrome P450
MTATSDAFWITRNPVGRGRDWLQSRRRTDAPRPPGPRGRPFVGVLPEYKADTFGYLRHLGDVYGDIYRVPLPLCDMVVVNNPDHVGHIMNCRQGEYANTVGPGAGIARIAMGASMAMLDGEKFRQRRKLLAPMFGRRQLIDIAGCLADEFAKRLARWDRFAESGEPIDLQQELPGVIMPAFMRTMFSLEMDDAELHQIDADVGTWLNAYTLAFLSPLSQLLREIPNVLQAWLRVQRWVKRLVDERLADDRPYDDMLQVILDAHRQDGRSITRRDVVTEIMVLMGGGWESVASMLAVTLGALPQNSQAQQRLYDEVDQLGGAVPTFDDLDRLQWAKACFDEGLRLQGTPFLLRFATVHDVMGGYRIRRGNLIGVSLYALQRDSRWWGPDADTYDPVRFYDKDIVAARPNLAFIPFGAGPHRCFGATMGYISAQFLLAQLHQRFRVQIPPDWVARHDPRVPWPIKGDVPAVLTKVAAAAN